MINTDIYGYLPELLSHGFPKSSPKMRLIEYPILHRNDSRDSIYQIHFKNSYSFSVIDYVSEKRDILEQAKNKQHWGKFNRSLLEDINIEYLIDKLVKYTGLLPCHEYCSKDGAKGILFELLSRMECDVAMVTLRPDGTHYISLVHLVFPNGWSAEEAIGKDFQYMHRNVQYSDGKHVLPMSDKFVEGLIMGGKVFERVGAYSMRDKIQLQRHPNDFIEPDFNNLEKLYIRFERQTIVNCPDIRSFIFFIHTHYVDTETNPKFYCNAIANADLECYPRKTIEKYGSKMLEFLKKRI